MNRLVVSIILAVGILFTSHQMVLASDNGNYEGFKKCGGCHKSQKDSWLETKHAKTMETLKPKVEAEKKKKAKLDPEKDYTNDKDCLPCHTTGFGERGGYKASMSESQAKFLTNIGCENCHGAGSLYRKEHSDAGKAFKATQKPSPRQKLVDAGEIFDYEEACARCHMNYEGSPWKGAKEPYTPFTPKVDAKYKFDFSKAVKDKKALHEHFKLRGVYEGEPVPKIRAEFQKGAKEAAAGEEEEK
ncbi:MAG: cytochrome c family protein [Deltaproteobacteria bacterium]|nr:cytochrome c family protein [Deltaproteobacteria bacterium]